MSPTADSSAPPLPPSGLLVVTVDRLPAWMLSAWGATWVATPGLDALAARGVVFDRMLTTAVDPRLAAQDLLGGAGGDSVLARAVARGRSVAVVSDQAELVDAVVPERAKEAVVVVARRPDRLAGDESTTNLGRLFTAASTVVAGGRHDVVWVHAGGLGVAWDAPDALRQAYLDPDDPPPPPGAEVPNGGVDAATEPDALVSLRHVFAAQLTLLDHAIAGLLAVVPGGWAVLVAGLRGMPLGLHGWCGGAGLEPDRFPPFGESIHVPAILVDAGGRMAGQRYGGLVVPADLGATLHHIMGDEVPLPVEPWQGRSLGPLLEAWQPVPRDRVVVRTPAGDAIVTPAWHLIDTGAGPADRRVALYAKPDDFFEQTDVADRCADVAEELARVLGRSQGDPAAAWRGDLSNAARNRA